MNGKSEAFLLNRRARVLRVVALVSSVLGGLTTVISITNLLGLTFNSQSLPTKLGYFSVCASCLIVSVVCYWLGRKGQARSVRVGAYLIIGLWALMVTALTTFSPVVASSFVLPILGAGMLLAAREIVGWTVAILVLCATSFSLNIALNLTPDANSQTAINSAGYYSIVSYLILLSVTGSGLWYLQVNTRTILSEISRRLFEISQLSEDREQKRRLGLQVGQTMRQQATELSGVSVQQEDEARKQVEAVGAMILVMEQLNQSARQVAKTSNEGVAVAERTRQSASNVRQTAAQASQTTQEGLNTTEETITAINEVQTQITSLENRLEELVNRSGQISRVVEVMRTLADQTHLLALNAAIESAGAGEHGRRFAVVADEVKQLADHSLVATREVQQIVRQTQEAIQEASQVSLTARQQSAGAVERARRCGSLIGELGEVIQLNFNRADDILNETRRVNDIMSEIAVINDQQRQTAEEITDVLRSVGQVARENAGVTKQLNQAAGQLEILSSELTVALAGSVEQRVLSR